MSTHSEYETRGIYSMDSIGLSSGPSMRHLIGQADHYGGRLAPSHTSYREPIYRYQAAQAEDTFISSTPHHRGNHQSYDYYGNRSFRNSHTRERETEHPNWSYGQHDSSYAAKERSFQQHYPQQQGYGHETYPEDRPRDNQWEMRQLEQQLSRRQLHPSQQRDARSELAHQTALSAASIALRGASVYHGNESFKWNPGSRIATPATSLYPHSPDGIGGLIPRLGSTSMSRSLPSIPLPERPSLPYRDDYVSKPELVRPPSTPYEGEHTRKPFPTRTEDKQSQGWNTSMMRSDRDEKFLSSPLLSNLPTWTDRPLRPFTTAEKSFDPYVPKVLHTDEKDKSQLSDVVKPRRISPDESSTSTSNSSTPQENPSKRRRCGRKSMNFSSEQKRERNRAAVKKCRQRQALKYHYLKRKAQVLTSENRALSDMLFKNVELDEDKQRSLTCGIQMDILLKMKEIFTQSLPRDFVFDADSIWDVNAILAVSMPSRCYYGLESIKEFWKTSLRMRNKGKIRSFWAWLFRLPPGERFSSFHIQSFTTHSNLYYIHWETKSNPVLSGTNVILFGSDHRIILHIEIFGWLIWKYLLANKPFPETIE